MRELHHNSMQDMMFLTFSTVDICSAKINPILVAAQAVLCIYMLTL